MKRLSEAQRVHNIKRSEFEERRKRRRRDRARQREEGIGYYERVILEVPRKFNLRDGIDDTLRFFNRLRRTVLSERKLGLIDFRNCVSISAGVGLVLAAETERCRSLRFRDGKPTLTGTYPADHGMRRFLDELGFYRLLKVQSHVSDRTENSPTRFIAMRSGRRDRGEDVHYVTEVLGTDSVQLDGESRGVLYEGLLEAMNNVTAHAYPDQGQEDRLPVLKGHWWAAGHWDNERREIGVMIYDQGVGIPATLPSSKHHALLSEIRRRLGLGTSDQESIRAAMEIGKSRLESGHRGHGMASLRHAVDRVADGHLLILSGTGLYGLVSGGQEEVHSLPTPMGGTLIEWRIRDENLITWNNA